MLIKVEFGAILCIFLIFFTFNILVLQNGFGDHVPPRKFAVFDQYLTTEIKGIVARVAENTNLYIVPDPNYRNLLLQGNIHSLTTSRYDEFFNTETHVAFETWKQIQQNVKNCGLSPESYPEPYPIIKLEKYGYDAEYGFFETAPFIHERPYVKDPPWVPSYSNYSRPIDVCDHVRVVGHYVIDHGHNMYSDGCIQGPDRHRLGGLIQYDTCYPHAELHPYYSNSLNFIERLQSPRWDIPNVETLSVVVPYYGLYYQSDFYNEFIPEVAGQVIDNEIVRVKDVTWFIQAPPKPPDAWCYTGCKLVVEEEIIAERGTIQTSRQNESNGVRVSVHAQASDDIDYAAVGRDTWFVGGATIFQAKYSVYWTNQDECVKYNPDEIQLNQLRSTNWKVESGGVVLGNFETQEKALKLFDFIEEYDLNIHCSIELEHSSVDNPLPRKTDGMIEYFLKDGAPPIINTTNHIVDYCEDINPTDIYIYELGEIRYLRSESTYFTYNFFYNYQGAEESLDAIKKYGFDQFCTVGGLMKHNVPFPGDDGILRH